MLDSTDKQQLVTLPLSDQLLKIILKRITDLVYPLGSKIDVENLKKEFGVSHIPIRDAMHKLSEQGLVVVVPRIGYFTATFSITEIEELFEVRNLIEGYAVGRCVKNVDTKLLQNLRESCEEWRGKSTAPPASAKTFFEIGEILHNDAIVRAARSPLIEKFYRDISNKIRMVARMRYLPVDENADFVMIPPEDTDEHIALIEALQRKDKPGARKALRLHLAAVKKRIFSENRNKDIANT